MPSLVKFIDDSPDFPVSHNKDFSVVFAEERTHWLTGEKKIVRVTRNFDSPYQARVFAEQIRHSRNRTLISCPSIN